MAAPEPDRPDETPEGGPVKTFLEHLEDFRWVLIKSIVALVVAMIVCLVAANYVMNIIKWPLNHAYVRHPGSKHTVVVNFGANHVGNFQLTPQQQQALNLGTNRFVTVEVQPLVIGTNQVLGWHIGKNSASETDAHRLNVELVNLSPAGGFVVAFQVGLYGGALVAAPFIFYFIASFVFPALKFHERRHIYRGLFIGIGLFLLGVAFCFFALMPVALAAAQMYSNWLGLGALEWRAEDYISFVCKFMLGMGLGFELPVVILTLVKIGVLDYSTLSKARRYMIIINLILGAVLTTPEPITQVVMFVPLQFLYELTVWIAWYWDQPDRAKARRMLGIALLVVLLLAGLIWAGWTHGWPWIQEHWQGKHLKL